MYTLHVIYSSSIECSVEIYIFFIKIRHFVIKIGTKNLEFDSQHREKATTLKKKRKKKKTISKRAVFFKHIDDFFSVLTKLN